MAISSNTTQLLVSVANSSEAQLVRRSPIEILDIKNPPNGPLGRPDAETINEILRIENPRRQMSSAALGECTELDFDLVDFFVSSDPARKLDFAKFGFGGAAECNWQKMTINILNRLPEYLTPVLAGYVDHQQADSPPIEEILAIANDCHSPLVLLDTFDKRCGDFFTYVSPDTFARWNELAKKNRIRMAVAGSLSSSAIEKAFGMLPAIVAVRGAACENSNRGNAITADSLCRFVNDVANTTAWNSAGCSESAGCSQPE